MRKPNRDVVACKFCGDSSRNFVVGSRGGVSWETFLPRMNGVVSSAGVVAMYDLFQEAAEPRTGQNPCAEAKGDQDYKYLTRNPVYVIASRGVTRIGRQTIVNRCFAV
jgi:hypothetical protein